jgi:hypothetical protein
MDPYVHLTNRSVQKTGSSCKGEPETKDEDHILTLGSFHEWGKTEMPNVCYIAYNGSSANTSGTTEEAWTKCTWPRILTAVRTALLACQPESGGHPLGCFELFGFDFMLDKHMRPLHLEAN